MDDLQVEQMPKPKPVECRHCGQLISPCRCGYGGNGQHWQDAAAPRGLGNRHCQGMPHQEHEPKVWTNG